MLKHHFARIGKARVAVAGALLLGLAACASPFNAKVSRFQSQLPPPQGQTVAVVADDPAMAGGIEFSNYARLVEARLAQAAAARDQDAMPAAPNEGPPRLELHSTDVPQLAAAMMFHDVLGAESYSQGPSRYQAFLDMSRLLQGNQAILFARAANIAGSNWSDGEEKLASDQDRRWVYYRFVIPLVKAEE